MKIKFITLNFWRGEILENALEFFKKEDPDILTLQEVYDGKSKTLPNDYRGFDYLKEQFPVYTGVFGAQFCDITKYGNIEEGNAIYSKFPILESKRTFFDIGYSTINNRAKTRFDDNPQNVLYAKIDLGGKDLNVFNTHGIWGFDGKDNPRRFQMVETILGEIGGKKNVILAGDFNMNPDTEAIKRIEKSLSSVFGTSLQSTFNMKRKDNGGYANAAVDMVFISSDIKILSKKCPQIDVSDHLPLVVELEV